MKNISKLRSNNYERVIEVRVPVRFYWTKDGYDGFEFGSLEGCTKYQNKLLDQVIAQLHWESQAGLFVKYIQTYYPEHWRQLVEAFDAEIDVEDIPQAFFDAFKEERE